MNAPMKKCPLSEVCVITMGQSPDSNTYNTEGIGLPFFQGCADFGQYHPNVTTWCSTPNKIAQPNDILMSVRAPIGTLNIADVKCCIGRGLASFRAIPGKTISKFLYYFLKASEGYLQEQGTGAIFKAIGKSSLINCPIYLPTIDVQQRIVDELDLLTGVIEKKNEQLKILDKLADSIFYEMFGDPVSNEKGWPINLFGSICNSELGKMLDAKRAKGTNKPYLCTINVLWDKIDLSTVKEMPFEDGELERYSIKKGDLLICEGGDTGRTAIWDRDETVYYQNSIHRVRLDEEKMLPQVVLYIMKIYKQQGILNSYSSGQTIKHLVKKSLLSIPVPTPPIDKQRVFAQKLDKLKSSQQLIEHSIGDAQQLLASRMDKYFSE